MEVYKFQTKNFAIAQFYKWRNLVNITCVSNNQLSERMNHFIKEFQRIKATYFSNENQIERAVNTKKFIDANYDKDVNLELLAKLQFSSKFHLLRVFKRYYGQTPRQYLIFKRIAEAKSLLSQGKSVSETCYAVGFESLHSFSNLFKSKTGQTPSQYRAATFDKS